MSAIWGVISKDNIENNQKTETQLKSGYKKCVIDRFESFVGKDCAMGCGIQYFTEEAKSEQLPIVDEENGIYFTADVILDNRDELMVRLGVTDNNVPDGKLLFEMFNRYREKCLDELLGIYAFVYYDSKRQECYLVTDSTGSRSLHYYVKGEEIYFSTLMEPIAEVSGHKELNEQWIVDFLALDNMAWAINYENTPYADIYRVLPSGCIKISKSGIEKKCYWNPTTDDIKGKSDKEYKKMFADTYIQAVKRMMRTDNISLLLSGGLDSTSIACIASAEAAKTGKTITTYTSIPENDFNSKVNPHYVPDEKEAVLKTKVFLEKRGTPIECEFVDLAGTNSWDDRIDEIEAIEVPYKSMQNLLWIKECMKKAYAKGSRMIFTGGYGNVTISGSSISIYEYELIRKGNFIQFFKHILTSKKKAGLGWKKTISICRDIIREAVKVPEEVHSDVLGKTLIKHEYADKYAFQDRVRQDLHMQWEGTYYADKSKQFMKNDKIYYQVGETHTKHSLATGVIQRDPTMDKRVIELCMRLPIGQFGKNGVDRRLVREYLSEYMPEHVIKNKNVGLQSADTALKLQKSGKRVFDEMAEIFKLPVSQKYLDIEKAMDCLKDIQDFDKPEKNFEVLRVEYTALTMEFINRNFGI